MTVLYPHSRTGQHDSPHLLLGCWRRCQPKIDIYDAHIPSPAILKHKAIKPGNARLRNVLH